MRQVQLKEVKLGDYFKRTERGPVWVRGEYMRGDKSYSVFKFEDVNHESFLKPTQMVWVDFTF
jgi:hypothetical protein